MASIPPDQPQGPLPQDGTVLKSFTSGASQTFLFPITAQSFYFQTRGNYQIGKLRFELAPANPGPPIPTVPEVTVNILISSDSAVAFNISLLEQNDNTYGIGFYTPNTITSNPPALQFTVTVQFPATTHSPLFFQNLAATLGNWAQTFNVNNLVNFRGVSLTSGNGSVDINGAILGTTTIVVGTGSVNGSFTSTQNVNITTTNGTINVTTTIIKVNESNPSTCELTTTNGALTANISLNSYSPGSVLNVKATTGGGALSLSFPNLPVTLPFPILNLNGTTSNGPIDVSLNPTYEGTIELITAGVRNVPVLNVDSSVRDPSGHCRSRVITGPTMGRGSLTAGVGWEEASPPNTGSVVLVTANGENVCNI